MTVSSKSRRKSKGGTDGVSLNGDDLTPVEAQASPTGWSERIAKLVGDGAAGATRSVLEAVKKNAMEHLRVYLALLLTSAGASAWAMGLVGSDKTLHAVERGLNNKVAQGAACSANALTAAQIDALLADPQNYDNEAREWKIAVSGERFRGKQYAPSAKVDHLPVSVTGSMRERSFFLATMVGQKGEGIYRLTADPAEDGVYRGRQIALDCAVNVVLSCPYFIGPEDKVETMRKMAQTAGPCRRFE